MGGRTYQMCIAGALVRETVFSKVEQYFTVVERASCLDTMFALCKVLKKNAVVVCGGGIKAVQILQQEAAMRGCAVDKLELDNALCISAGSEQLLLLAEVDAPEREPLTYFYNAEGAVADEEELPDPMPATGIPEIFVKARQLDAAQARGAGRGILDGVDGVIGGRGSKGGGKGGKGGQAEIQAKDELPIPATMPVPPVAAEAGLIIVIGGHFLRETASLTSVICGVHGTGGSSAPLPMFHLVTDVRQVILETEEELHTVAAGVSADGRVHCTVELLGQPRLPVGAALLAQEGMSSPALPEALQLPAIVNFKLHSASLGLIVRLRERYGCAISEVFNNVLSSLLAQSSGDT